MGNDVDVIVVGSGFGGAPMAARLAAAGRRVVVVERGPWWGPSNLDRPRVERRDFPRGPAGFRKVLRNVRWDRGGRHHDLRVHDDGLFEISVFDRLVSAAASGVGGGSLVHTAITVRAPDAWLADLPDEIGRDGLEEGYVAVEDLLRPMPVPDDGAREHRFRVAALRSSMRAPQHPPLSVAFGAEPSRPSRFVNAAGVEQGTCVGCGECVLGCQHRAKTSLDLTHLALAERAGAQIRALSEVLAIGPGVRRRGEESGWQVRFRDLTTGTEHTLDAPVLVLAAGTMNTLRLLIEARDRHRTIPDLPETLGQRVSTNGDVLGAVVGRRAHAAGAPGPSVTSVTQPDLTTTGTPGARLLAEMAVPASALPLPPRLAEVARSSMLLLAMGVDGPGRVTWDHSGLSSDLGRATGEGIHATIEDDLGRLAAELEGDAVLNLPAGAGADTIATVHPLGGATVGSDPATSVVDHAGQVWGHPGLYVTDGAVLPRSPGVPPSLTIAAFAERAAAVLTGSA